MKSEIRFKKPAVLLLAAALIGTVLAAFLPYALEPLLGLAAACIAVHTVYLAYEKFINPFWLSLAAMAVSAVSVVLTLVLILGHQLGLYTLIQALSLPSKGESSRCSVPYSLRFWVRAANFTCARSSVFSFRVSFRGSSS